MKSDIHARRHWGDAYDTIPKSVFATACWHLANVASDSADAEGAAERRFIEELRALASNEIIPEPQVRRAVKALPEDLTAD